MWKKKVISLLMSVILVIGCVFASELDVKAITRSEVTSQLNSLIGQYNGKTVQGICELGVSKDLRRIHRAVSGISQL